MTATTALVLVDVLDGFFSVDGSMYYPTVTDVVPSLRTLLDTARERDRLVVHAVERHYEALDDFEHHHIPPHCVVGSADAAYFSGFAPVERPREVEVAKRRYSAFFATDLDLLLREQGIDTVVIAGVKTNVCIRATVQDAFANGYRVRVPRQATNSNRPHLAAASLEDIDRYFGQVLDTEQVTEQL